eukprot:5399461-Pyramimonas_sp.AAC.1
MSSGRSHRSRRRLAYYDVSSRTCVNCPAWRARQHCLDAASELSTRRSWWDCSVELLLDRWGSDR